MNSSTPSRSGTAKQVIRWHPHPDPASLMKAALDAIADSAAQAIRSRGAFHIVLAGGNTPRAIYQQCRSLTTDWSAWHVYFGDERCLPPDNPDRNSFMASQAWLEHVPIPPQQIHNIPAERDAIPAAAAYTATLQHTPDFDLVLLGLGEDGHTASLFPGHDAGTSESAPDAIPVFDAPKPPPTRVSLSARRLARTRQAIFLVTGIEKQTAVKRWLAGDDIPAHTIAPPVGVDVFCEARLLPTG